MTVFNQTVVSSLNLKSCSCSPLAQVALCWWGHQKGTGLTKDLEQKNNQERWVGQLTVIYSKEEKWESLPPSIPLHTHTHKHTHTHTSLFISSSLPLFLLPLRQDIMWGGGAGHSWTSDIMFPVLQEVLNLPWQLPELLLILRLHLPLELLETKQLAVGSLLVSDESKCRICLFYTNGLTD